MTTERRDPPVLEAVDGLGERVRQVYAGERLSAEQRSRHLSRLHEASREATHRRKGIGKRRYETIAFDDGDGVTPDTAYPRVIRLPLDDHWGPRRPERRTRRVFRAIAAVLAVAIVGSTLLAAFRLMTVTDESAGRGEEVVRQGWFYPAAGIPGGGAIAYVARGEDGKARIEVVYADGGGRQTVTPTGPRGWEPYWAPNGRQVAYTKSENGAERLAVLDMESADVEQRTTVGSASRHPAWSPDGTRIAFVATVDFRTGIYVMDANGRNPHIVTDAITIDGDTRPVWSPDSSRIVFETGGDIYSVTGDGGDLQQLTVHEARDASPQWSPDGTEIAFVSERTGKADIFVMNADGTDPRNVTNTRDALEDRPVWSPDGWSIAYLRQPVKSRPDGETQLYVMGANGSIPRRLGAFSGSGMSEPAWSPDGNQVAVAVTPRLAISSASMATGTNTDTGATLYAVNADGTRERLLADRLADLSPPVWRPVWWPASLPGGQPDDSQPVIGVTPEDGNCDTTVRLDGKGFEPGMRVTVYAGPAPDGSYAPLRTRVEIDADGRFTMPVDLNRYSGCALGGEVPTGAAFHIGVALTEDDPDGALPELVARVIYYFRSDDLRP